MAYRITTYYVEACKQCLRSRFMTVFRFLYYYYFSRSCTDRCPCSDSVRTKSCQQNIITLFNSTSRRSIRNLCGWNSLVWRTFRFYRCLTDYIADSVIRGLHGDSEIAAHPTKLLTRNLADQTDAGEILMVEWHSRSVHLALVGFLCGMILDSWASLYKWMQGRVSCKPLMETWRTS